MPFAVVGEARVHADGDVVQEDAIGDAADVDAPLHAAREGGERAERVVAVDADVAGEVIPRAPRDAREWHAALDRDARHHAERPVAAGYPEHTRICATRERRQVLALAEDVRLDVVRRRRFDELVVTRAVVPRARVHEQEAAHDA